MKNYKSSLIYHKIHYIYFTLKNIFKHFGNIKYLKLPKANFVKNGFIIVTHEANKRGASILAGHIAKELVTQGHPVFIISKQFGELCDEYKDICFFKISLNHKSFKRTIRELSHLGYSSIILNTSVNGDLAKFSKLTGLKVISLIHETIPAITDLCVADRVLQMIKYSDKIIYPTNILKSELEQLFGTNNNSTVLPQGLYLRGGILHLEKNYKNIVLAVGDVSLRKGFDIFIETAKSFVGKADFCWIGNGRDNRFYYETLEKNGNVFPANFYFFKDMSSKELLEFYPTASVFVLTSRYDTFPSVMLESMNAGVPVVGFESSGGIVELVENGYNGLLVKGMENITEMTEAINYFLNMDKSDKLIVSNNCKETAKKYSFQNYIKEIIS